MDSMEKVSKKIDPDILDAIISATEKIGFGQIVIKIQDKRIVQIDTLERRRVGNFLRDKNDGAEYHI